MNFLNGIKTSALAAFILLGAAMTSCNSANKPTALEKNKIDSTGRVMKDDVDSIYRLTTAYYYNNNKSIKETEAYVADRNVELGKKYPASTFVLNYDPCCGDPSHYKYPELDVNTELQGKNWRTYSKYIQ